MKVVLDANVIVAAFASRGLCEAILELCLSEHEIILCAGPLTGLTQYPGSGKMHSVTLSPETGAPVDNNGGGFFAPFLKFSGFDVLEVRGKETAGDVLITIDSIFDPVNLL